MAVPAVSGLKTLLRELSETFDSKRTDSKQSRTYVADLIGTIDGKLREFVEKAEAVGDANFRPVFEDDAALWQYCLKQRGLGSGYRERVGVVISEWFKLHRHLVKKVDGEVHKAWTSTFLAWAKEIAGD